MKLPASLGLRMKAISLKPSKNTKASAPPLTERAWKKHRQEKRGLFWVSFGGLRIQRFHNKAPQNQVSGIDAANPKRAQCVPVRRAFFRFLPIGPTIQECFLQ